MVTYILDKSLFKVIKLKPMSNTSKTFWSTETSVGREDNVRTMFGSASKAAFAHPERRRPFRVSRPPASIVCTWDLGRHAVGGWGSRGRLSAAREAQRCAGVTGGASPWESSECNAPAPCRGNLHPQRNYGRGCCASCGAASPRPRRTSPSHSAQLRGYVEVARRRRHNRPKLEHWLCPAPGSRRGASQRDLGTILSDLEWVRGQQFASTYRT